ncbi:hypothetical protein PF008_g18177 [Phytophthora fragariae]|uniref:Uncharacterized protein n=1 Tax=Phytophthora fragariae TaxID=53985 RepID=A0A6G0R6F2_9STRA|nr:hypothetical protein PF008_g18177 [Phytophthora fragariae]
MATVLAIRPVAAGSLVEAPTATCLSTVIALANATKQQ